MFKPDKALMSKLLNEKTYTRRLTVRINTVLISEKNSLQKMKFNKMKKGNSIKLMIRELLK